MIVPAAGGRIMSTSTLVILGIIVVVVLWAISIYNGLVAMRQRVNQSFADIDVQLRQRHDLIPNLVETVKGYASHERGTLEAVIQARNSAVAALWAYPFAQGVPPTPGYLHAAHLMDGVGMLVAVVAGLAEWYGVVRPPVRPRWRPPAPATVSG